MKRKIKILYLRFILFLSIYLKRFTRRNKQKYRTNKVLYIGHSYHQKTQSTKFIIDLLRKNFEVKVILDETWIDKAASYPDLGLKNNNYAAIIFCQLLPPKEIFRKIQHDNIIFIPMYDQSGLNDYGFWFNEVGCKVICFSKTLYTKLRKWGFDTIHIQYFPKPAAFSLGSPAKAFFWQRLTKINFQVIKKLIQKSKLSVHIHRAIDPGNRFFKPEENDEKKYRITYSDWFKTKEDMLTVMKESAIYFAPREYEGIGLSFLEAMSMGKAVVAVNNPTMNEYITHGETGYLYDLNSPKQIDFSNIQEVQKKSYEYMKRGYQEWLGQQDKIIDFICK